MRRYVVASFLCCLLAACAAPNSKGTLLEATLATYESAIRWGNFDEASGAIDPEVLKEHPVSDQQLEQYKKIQVSSYTAQPARPAGQDEIAQTVQIDLVDTRTQTMRSVTDHQRWRYDAKAKRWWLMTGLPDFSKH